MSQHKIAGMTSDYILGSLMLPQVRQQVLEWAEKNSVPYRVVVAKTKDMREPERMAAIVVGLIAHLQNEERLQRTINKKD